jgi:hypothetical protein
MRYIQSENACPAATIKNENEHLHYTKSRNPYKRVVYKKNGENI